MWAIRDVVGLTGTKYGCGMALCGDCLVHLDGAAVAGKTVTTIEGADSAIAKAVQDAWLKLEVVQRGYCQSGQIVPAIDLLSRNPHPTDKDIDDTMARNICRCNSYGGIRAAIKRPAQALV